MTMYWSSLTITKCGQQPWPSSSPQNALEIFDTLIGVLVFATIIGGVGSVVTQMSAQVNDFREMMDGIKFYMKYRGVQQAIQDRVLNCFLYLNSHNQLYDEEEVLSLLPPRFQANIAANLHQDTLSKVSLFYKCDQRLLQEVVMLVKQQVYSPNDYLCRKNEKAKEMFIGNLLGDRRSVSLRSVGYSDVYVLHQDDVTRLLQEYPEERSRLYLALIIFGSVLVISLFVIVTAIVCKKIPGCPMYQSIHLITRSSDSPSALYRPVDQIPPKMYEAPPPYECFVPPPTTTTTATTSSTIVDNNDWNCILENEVNGSRRTPPRVN
uniref:Cyclic nucleotide-binding domain-containing protein n=1 Tax=Caenorhabditis tropicalis TaxID=1561998 RepID=A0A1I7TQF4_9PELO